MLTAKIFVQICCDKLTLGSKNTPQKPVFNTKIFFGRFSAAFPQKWRPYGRQFFSAINFYLRPVLSYFAEFSAGWQQCMTGAMVMQPQRQHTSLVVRAKSVLHTEMIFLVVSEK
jgi:hypothetical protein